MIKNNLKNEGFTLVELIVVIAVLGVITVLAIPQFTKYVEKARVGTDKNAMGEVLHAAEVAYVAYGKQEGRDEFQIKIRSNGTTIYSPSVSNFVNKIEETVPAYVYKSEEYRGKTYTIKISEDGEAESPDVEGNKKVEDTMIDASIGRLTIFKGTLKELTDNRWVKAVVGEVTEEEWENLNDYLFETDNNIDSIVDHVENKDFSEAGKELLKLLDEASKYAENK